MTKFQKVLSGLTLLFLAASANAVIVELEITFDDFPNETAFGMWNAGAAPTGSDYYDDPDLAFSGIAYDVGLSSPIGFGDGYVIPGDFCSFPGDATCFPVGGDDVSFETHSFIWDLGVGSYTFIIMDSFGDGICCGFGDGSYSLTVGGNLVNTGGTFADEDGQWELTSFDVVAAVPEPGFLALLALGLIGVGLSRRRKV